MSTKKVDAKKIRREVHRQQHAMREQMVVQILQSLCSLPLPQRAKWAWRVLKGDRRRPDRLLICVTVWMWRLDWLLDHLTGAHRKPAKSVGGTTPEIVP